MRKRKERSVRTLNRVLILVTALASIYTIFTFSATQINVAKKNIDLNTLKDEITQQEYTNYELIDTLEQGATPEAIAKVAKDKLGLAMPGERVIIDIGSK